ncbi:RNA polymerase sigma factor [Pelosinus sp. sgz500959]|uniref:RNA polymerase sigma factor n=1 Tax=Pelosinus sp. sgz500959 TaxID=3242472 RepID=UPI00366CB4AA
MYNQQKDIVEIITNERNRFLQYVRRKITDISEMDAEDIVADVIFNVYNKVDLQYHIENVLAYMYRSIKNRMTDYLRQSSKQISLDKMDEASGITILETLIDTHADIEMNLQQTELRDQLYAAVMKLEPKQRAVWIATEIEGYTFKELSEKWGEPIGTLLSRKSRAGKVLKKILKDLV